MRAGADALRRCGAVAIALLLANGRAFGQAPAPAPTPVLTAEPDSRVWSYSASAYTYFVHDDRDYVQPTLAADRSRLHLEARYNYEALETGSAWIGWNFSAGDSLAFEFTPMMAAVFGTTTGFAPGYEAALSWKRLELYSESEYMFDSNSASDDFFYSWSQLTVAPLDWLRCGVVLQRTQAYESERDTQRGLLVGYSRTSAAASVIVFNPDDDQPTVVVSIALEF